MQMQSYVPEYITLNLLLSTLLLSALASLIAGAVFAIFETRLASVPRQALWNAVRLLGFSFPIALVAYIAGYLSTMGRSSTIGNVLPAVLALVGGLNLYVFGSEHKYRVLISYCVVLFASMLLYGTQYGAYKRDTDQEFRLRELIKVEAKLKLIRKNLDLPDDFPAWILGTEPR
jgi:hypothetical protein